MTQCVHSLRSPEFFQDGRVYIRCNLCGEKWDQGISEDDYKASQAEWNKWNQEHYEAERGMDAMIIRQQVAEAENEIAEGRRMIVRGVAKISHAQSECPHPEDWRGEKWGGESYSQCGPCGKVWQE